MSEADRDTVENWIARYESERDDECCTTEDRHFARGALFVLRNLSVLGLAEEPKAGGTVVARIENDASAIEALLAKHGSAP